MSTIVDPRANTGQGTSGTGSSSTSGSPWIFPNNPAAKAGNYTITALDGTIKIDASAAQRTVNLPDAATFYANGMGQVFVIKKVDASANTVVIQAANNQMIDGFNTVVINQQWDGIMLQSFGTSWDILSTI